MSVQRVDPVLDVPAERVAPLRSVLAALDAATAVLITTHVNADGDGAGCEAALAAWLAGRGKRVWIANPTPLPAVFRHLVERPDWIAEPGSAAATAAMREADALLVVDTGEPKRIGRIAPAARSRPVIVLDHHQPSDTAFAGTVLQDAAACATGELVYDLLSIAREPKPWPAPIREGVYTAIVTDTGSFRFSNTTPRAHAIAGDLIAQGVDPELEYRRIYATVPLRRVHLLRHALDGLAVDDTLPLTWITIDREAMDEFGASSEDVEGVIDHARDIEGTEIAILFRETSDGQTKVSLRSGGAVDVNGIAREFGGGGHVKASGALVPGPLAEVRPRVLDAARAALRDAGLNFRASRAAG